MSNKINAEKDITLKEVMADDYFDESTDETENTGEYTDFAQALPDSEKVAKKRVRTVKVDKLPDETPTVVTRDTNPVTASGLLAPQPSSTNRVL